MLMLEGCVSYVLCAFKIKQEQKKVFVRMYTRAQIDLLLICNFPAHPPHDISEDRYLRSGNVGGICSTHPSVLVHKQCEGNVQQNREIFKWRVFLD